MRIKGLDLFLQFGSYHLICSNKQLITGSMKFPDDSTAGMGLGAIKLPSMLFGEAPVDL